jgi:hypothetical protein
MFSIHTNLCKYEDLYLHPANFCQVGFVIVELNDSFFFSNAKLKLTSKIFDCEEPLMTNSRSSVNSFLYFMIAKENDNKAKEIDLNNLFICYFYLRLKNLLLGILIIIKHLFQFVTDLIRIIRF